MSHQPRRLQPGKAKETQAFRLGLFLRLTTTPAQCGIVGAMASRRDIFDTGAKPSTPKAKPTPALPADVWVPVPHVPLDDDEAEQSFDAAADDIQRMASANRAHYLHELELLATAWRSDMSLAATSARAVMHLISLAGGGPQKRPLPPVDQDGGADTDVPDWTPRVRRDG